MPDSKISGLTSATTPLAGTEVLPIVQSGQTRQVSVANLTAGRAMSAGLITSTGGLVAPGVLTNFADPSGWTTGTGTATGYFGGNFTANGTVAAEDTRQYSSTPVVSPGLVWSATSSDTASDAEGGWNKTITGLVDSKTYRSVVWVRRVTASTSGTFYHGCSASTTLNLNGTTNTNPYFGPTSISGLVQNRWYLSVGYIHANADASVTSYGGLYDSTTGAKVVNYTDFKLSSGATSQVHRTFLFYSVDTTTQLDLWGPRFEEVTGNEPSVYSMLLSSSNNVATATALQNTRTLWGQNFNGTANVTGSLTSVGNITGTAGVTLTATAGTLGLVATGANVITASTNGSERMRITSAGDVGIGTSSPGSLLHLNANNAEMRLSEVGTYYGSIRVDSAGGLTIASDPSNVAANSRLIFSVDNTERARIDASGNVGIGTSSPSVALQVNGTSNGATLELLRLSNTGTGANTKARLNFYAASTNYASITGGYGASAPEMVFDINTSAGAYIWNNNATEQMRIDSSGNLGLGVTPSAWTTVVPAIQLGSAGAFLAAQGSSTNVRMGVNAYYNGGYIYTINGAASMYQQAAGVHSWHQAASGTAGNAISFTQAMTLDASGNLGLGVTPSAWDTTFTAALQIGGAALTGTSGNNVALASNAYYNAGWKYYSTTTANLYQQISGQHRWYTAPSGTANNAISFTQAMTLDASGNLLVGKTSPTYSASNRNVFEINGTDSSIVAMQYGGANGAYFQLNSTAWYAWNSGNTPMVFATNNTERMRITSAGDVGIGTSSPGYKLDVVGSTSTARFGKLIVADDTPFYTGANINSGANALGVGSTGAALVGFFTNNTERLRITSTGDVGIGTSSPSAKLDVVGSVEATAFLDGPLYDSAFKRFTNPGGGIYTTTTASVTGAIRITFPVGATNTMVKVTVKVYEYQTNRSFEIHFGGYTSTSGPSWANNPYAYIVGNPTINRQFTVRLGYDSTAAKMVAYIGELASTWPYPQVYVTEVQCGYGGFSANFATGWAIGFEATAFQNVTATISNPQVGYQAVAGDAIQGSVRYTSTTNTSGCFYGGTTTPTGTTRLNYSGYLYPTFLNLIGSADTTTAATHYFVEQSSDGFVRPKTIANVRTEIVTTAAVSAATAAGAIAFAAGSAAAPSIYPTGDTNTGIFFPAADTIAFSEGGAESMRITSAGNVGIGTSSPSGKLHVYGGAIRTNSRVTNSQNYPLGHYSPGECVFEIDPTWTEAELQAFFNSSAVTWAAVADAPGGYCIYIDGAVNVGGVYNSGFSYIPVDTSDVYYMECWIQNVGSNQGHYMGSIDYNQSFSSLGGNPGSYGYWVMSNTDPGTTWTKVSGYIQGFGTAVSQFVAGTKYWTPMALFNYTAGTGTRACRISGWKVIRAYQPGNRFFSGNVGIGTSSPGAKLDVAGAARVQGDFFVYGTGDRFNVFPQTAGSGVNVVSTNNANSAYAQLTLDGIPLIFKVAGTERLRITSAGDVGIGTSSPSYTLDVRTNTSNAVRIGSSANAFGSLLSWDNSSGESRLMSIGAYALVFGTNTTERLRITAAGNIHTPAGSTTMTDGFIYIPAAAGAPTGVATAITGTVPLYYNSSANILYAYNSSWQTLIGTGTLPLISSNANGVVYLNSSSQATTSTALQFNGTELGVGVTPTAGVQIDVGAAAGSQIRVQAVTAGVDMRLNATGGAGNVGIVGTYSNHDAVFYTNATERARITAAGVLQLSPVAGEGGELNLLNPTSGTVGGYVDVSTANNFRLWTGNLNATMQIGQLSSTGGNIQFFTEASEKMRLTAAGVLGIGTSSPGGVGVHVQNNTGGALYYASGTVAAGGVTYLAYNASNAAGSTSTFTLWNDNGFSTSSVTIGFFSSGSTIPNELRINQGANAPMTFYTNGSECMRLTADGNLVREQPAPQALTASTTLTIAHLRTQIITVAGTGGNTITLTMPSVSTLNTYTTEMAVDTSFDVTFIATTTSNVNLSAVTNVTIVGSATITNNTSATYRFRKSSSTAFVVYRMT